MKILLINQWLVTFEQTVAVVTLKQTLAVVTLKQTVAVVTLKQTVAVVILKGKLHGLNKLAWIFKWH